MVFAPIKFDVCFDKTMWIGTTEVWMKSINHKHTTNYHWVQRLLFLLALFTCDPCTVAWLPAVWQEFLREPVKQQEAWGCRGNGCKRLPLTAAIKLAPNVLKTSPSFFFSASLTLVLFVRLPHAITSYVVADKCAHTEAVYVVQDCRSTQSNSMELFSMWYTVLWYRTDWRNTLLSKLWSFQSATSAMMRHDLHFFFSWFLHKCPSQLELHWHDFKSDSKVIKVKSISLSYFWSVLKHSVSKKF